ncbi:Oidioi.mRNA.OKI2018_I69.PAR.g11005.t1.cds [Oikopleura dioica]|uniref:Oidioi.mRNA.OKI2018_I69.PAR.g11005.t1.cds n=1 Tax=Oikopleura dioica TaxID=34765 RepID=A0ABN7RXX9_OIKDI|nr:Oidioi.mRNA.OKI2018_I69.PAR.g11005.t1.cds [Oikopleura dioica]
MRIVAVLFLIGSALAYEAENRDIDDDYDYDDVEDIADLMRCCEQIELANEKGQVQKSLRFTNLSLDKDGKPKLIYYMFDRNRKIDRDDAVIFNLKQNIWYNFDAQLKKTKFSGPALPNTCANVKKIELKTKDSPIKLYLSCSNAKPSRPAKKPVRPSKRPSKKPALPPKRPAKKPTRPSRRPAKKPVRPSKRPSKKPASPPKRPAKKPTRPSRRPVKKPTKRRSITFKPTGKNVIVGGNTFAFKGIRRDGNHKYSNGRSYLVFNPKFKHWSLNNVGKGWASGKTGETCPILKFRGKLFAVGTKCSLPKKKTKKKPVKKPTKKTKSKKQSPLKKKKSPITKKSKVKKSKLNKKPITLKPTGKKVIVGGNTFKFEGIRRDGVQKFFNGKSRLLFYPKVKQWSLRNKGKGWASGQKGVTCPILRFRGKLFAVGTECSLPKKKPATKKPTKQTKQKKGSKKQSPPKKKTHKKSSRTKKNKSKPAKPEKREQKKSKRAQKKPSITLKPAGETRIDGGNNFKFKGIRKDGVHKYVNGKSRLLFYPKTKAWALAEKQGWAIGKRGDSCPKLKRRGKLVATFADCSEKASKKPPPKTLKNQNKPKKSKPSKKSPPKKIVLKPTGKNKIVGGNTFGFEKIRKDGNHKYVNGNSYMLFHPKVKKWSLKIRGKGWAIGKKGESCPILKFRGKLFAVGSECSVKSSSKKKSTKKNKPANSKQARKSLPKKKSITLKPTGNNEINEGNTFKFKGIRRDGQHKYVNGKSYLLFNPKAKQWSLNNVGKGWASGKAGELCPKLKFRGKLFAAGTECSVESSSKKKASKKSAKKNRPTNSKQATKKPKSSSEKNTSKKSTKKNKPANTKQVRKSLPKKKSITLKPTGNNEITGGNTFKFKGIRRDGNHKYVNSKSYLLFNPKAKQWSLNNKGKGWASGKAGEVCPILKFRGKLFAVGTECSLPKKKTKKKPVKRPNKKNKSKKQSPVKKKKSPITKKSKVKKSKQARKKPKSSSKKKTFKKQTKKNNQKQNKIAIPNGVKKVLKLETVGGYKIEGGNVFNFKKTRSDGTIVYFNDKNVEDIKLQLGPKGRKWALKDKNGWAVGRSGDNCPTLKRRGRAVAKVICRKVAEKILAPANGLEIKGGNTFKYVTTWSTGVNDPKYGWAHGQKNEILCPVFKKNGKIIARFQDCTQSSNEPAKKSRRKSPGKITKRKKTKKKSARTMKKASKKSVHKKKPSKRKKPIQKKSKVKSSKKSRRKNRQKGKKINSRKSQKRTRGKLDKELKARLAYHRYEKLLQDSMSGKQMNFDKLAQVYQYAKKNQDRILKEMVVNMAREQLRKR